MPPTWPRFARVLKALVITEDTTRLTFSCGSSRHAAVPRIKQISGSNLAVGHGSLKRLKLIFTGGHASPETSWPLQPQSGGIHYCSQKFRGCLFHSFESEICTLRTRSLEWPTKFRLVTFSRKYVTLSKYFYPPLKSLSIPNLSAPGFLAYALL